MKFVEPHPRLRPDVLIRSRDMRWTHVHGDFRDRPVVSIMLPKRDDELFPYTFVFALHGEKHPLSQEIAKNLNVSMALACAEFIAAHDADFAPVQARPGAFHLRTPQPPQPGVGLLDDATGGGHGHFPHQPQREGFACFGEGFAQTLPRRRDPEQFFGTHASPTHPLALFCPLKLAKNQVIQERDGTRRWGRPFRERFAFWLDTWAGVGRAVGALHQRPSGAPHPSPGQRPGFSQISDGMELNRKGATPMGLVAAGGIGSQGSAGRATLGWRTERRWRIQ